ncbi:tetratricopeptide repeat protein [Flavobacterium sp.]|uniref:tetratricopeptide repeat protein n=1 Tax=Flavobacterium sp. TaxID=239 RepID=UPI002B4B5987|nr:tetratricopeptide repeat protein [Flavobacterium sp.]HLP64411.1 tetratricopeptide repeat protein [Flavobacterium sp.]
MATYNKRGYKPAKEKEEKLDNTFIEDTPNVDAKDSTTAKAFDALDQTASKTEEFVAKNQKYILGFLGAVAVVTIGYLMYQKFIVGPNEEEAANEIFVAQQNFQKAVDATTAQDSLFNLVLKGSEGKQGVVDIANQYSGTDAGNLANYYAGISYLNLGKYKEAIEYLEKFSSDDVMISTIAKGAIGDAFAQRNQPKEALEYYIKAAQMNENEFTTPRYLLKAGKTAYALGNKADALKYFTEIKEKFESSQEAQNIDALIGMVQ